MRLKKRGVFFVGVLFIVVLVAMFVAASFELGVWGLKRTASQGDLLLAERAARNGLDYALARLKADPGWKGHSATNPFVQDPGLVVVEDQGCVIGLMQNGGRTSQFRIRFNYHDGAGGVDGLPNPNPALAIGGPLLSINNLVPDSQTIIPLADGPGDSVPSNPNAHGELPAHAVFLVVEGRVGDWLASATPNNPNPPIPAGQAVTSSRVETVYKVTNVGAGTPAVLAAASHFKAQVASFHSKNNLELDSADTAHPGRLRTRGNLDVSGGQSGRPNVTSGKGGAELRVLGSRGAGLNQDSDVLDHTEAAGDVLLSLPWAQVKQAPATNTLPAGVYAFDENGNLHYYDMSLSDYMTHIQANPGDAGVTPVTLPSSMSQSFAGNKSTLRIVDDTLVTATAATSDLSIIPLKGVDGGPGSGGATPQASQIATAMQAFAPQGPLNFDFPEDAQQRRIGPLLHAVGAMAVNPMAVQTGSWILPTGGVINNLSGSNTQFGNFQTADWNYLSAQIVNFISSNPTDQRVIDALGMLSISGGSSEFQEASAVTDSADNNDITLEFRPNGTSAVLTGPGKVNIGTQLKGDGASITAEGDINLVGLGVNLASTTNPNEGVSLYSKGNVFISTFDNASSSFRDVALKGVVYCWGNFKAHLGHSSVTEPDWGKLKLTGALIAFGKDPADLTAPVTAGQVEIIGEEANLKYDPAYIQNLMSGLPSNILLGRTRWIQL